ncbi:S8 family peptidase [Amycolatopsis samaneae]|uniref:S8 family peptidase n=1 Tax=Amycolatopsis samaneae TaxID=664691 RepID=UPI0036721FE7
MTTTPLSRLRASAAVVLVGLTALNAVPAEAAEPAPTAAVAGVRTGMTWTVLGQVDGSVRVGADSRTDAYHGDTTVDQSLPVLCVLKDGRPKPGNVPDQYSGWLGGQTQATPPVPGAVLTSPAQGDVVCAETFGAGWRLAEFHDAGGWSFWGNGSIPAGTRFWTAINDQPANPWNSAGTLPAPGSVTPPKFLTAEWAVPGQFIASLPVATPESQLATVAAELVGRHGGTLLDVLPGTNGFSFTASDAQAQAMSADPKVETIEQDSYGEPNEVPWNLDRVDQRDLPLDHQPYDRGSTGVGVDVFLLDTGLRTTHQEFGGRASLAADFIKLGGVRDGDCNGHGTAAASVAGGSTLGVAPGANLRSVRVAGCQGNLYNPAISLFQSTAVFGLDWVAKNHQGPSVASLSYGFRPGFWRRWMRKPTPVDRAARRAIDSGVTVVASAGNGGRNADRQSPARADGVISVSAVDSSDNKPDWANYGKVDIFAPGVDVRTAGRESDGQYGVTTGTSISAPAVAGAAATYLQSHPGASPDEVRQVLLGDATVNKIPDPGPYSANRLLYVRTGPRPATHAGMTWTVLESRRSGRYGDIPVFHVGRDGAASDPYHGDTPAAAKAPILCLAITNQSPPFGDIPTTGFNAWANGVVKITKPVSGAALTSRAVADGICQSSFDSRFRMAEFHDGGGWSLWAFGDLYSGPLPEFTKGVRFWAAINDQTANPWN